MHEDDTLTGEGEETHPNERDTSTAAQHMKRIEDMYIEHREALVRFLRIRLRSNDEAQEVAQETFMQMIKLDDVASINQPQAYLYKTATNIAINRMKLGGIRKRLNQLAALDEPQDDPRTPQRTLDMQQQLRRVTEALERLSPLCRRAFLLVRYEEQTFDDVAAALKLHPRKVRRLVQRALASCERAIR